MLTKVVRFNKSDENGISTPHLLISTHSVLQRPFEPINYLSLIPQRKGFSQFKALLLWINVRYNTLVTLFRDKQISNASLTHLQVVLLVRRTFLGFCGYLLSSCSSQGSFCLIFEARSCFTLVSAEFVNATG
jgi:hypothetical protein